jgi:methylenetetrahydrofolate dehydrogenase (NADP+) / methenyltetrahydrofolate cyclohydrolase
MYNYTMKIDGRKIADQILDNLVQQVVMLKKNGIIPRLAVILVGEDPGSISFIKQKKLSAEKIGASLDLYHFQTSVNKSYLINLINKLNSDPQIHGIILQRPVPKFNAPELVELISPKKEVDSFLDSSVHLPPVGMAVVKILQFCHPDNFINWINTKKIILIGRGETAGTPIAKTLKRYQIKFNIVHTQTPNPSELIRTADIIFSAVGKPGIITAENIKKGVILIGVGLHDENTRLVGDYDEAEIINVASFYTPMPKGVGPVNVACLMENLISACKVAQ